jgi:ATP-binding protein involved in chromosome partitioning
MTVSKQEVLDTLRKISPPEGGDIVERGMVSDVFIADGKVYFSISVPAERAQQLETLRSAAEKAVSAISGVQKAVVTLTASKAPSKEGPASPAAPPRKPQAPGHGGPPREKIAVPGVEAIIAVASGKGGVGKSTTAVNLALALQAKGKRVGILDADIYGPSLPRLLGIRGKPEAPDGRVLKPMEGYGLKVMSMGFLVEEDTPMIWRGPMVISALTQMLREVDWGELDILVVDMPPGTGDAQLTMAQQVPLAGAVIVSTPQDLALIDARKGLNMFRRVDVPVLGIVENMSYFIAPDTGNRYDIFGHGGAAQTADALGVPFLGEVPLAIGIRETSDNGTPVVASDPDGPEAAPYLDIAEKVLAGLAGVDTDTPAIIFD